MSLPAYLIVVTTMLQQINALPVSTTPLSITSQIAVVGGNSSTPKVALISEDFSSVAAQNTTQLANAKNANDMRTNDTKEDGFRPPVIINRLIYRPTVGMINPLLYMVNPVLYPASTTEETPLAKTDRFSTANNSAPNNYTQQNISSRVPALNGLAAFCSYSAVQTCSNVSLIHCEECSMARAAVFVSVVAVLGLAIVIANVMVIWLFARGQSMFRGTYGKIKVSMSCADLLTGVLIFFVVLPNFSRTVMSTPDQLLQRSLASFGTAESSVGGVFYLLIFSSSLYHLVLLAQQRLVAVRWPIRYQQQSGRVVNFGLVAVWLLALVLSTATLWFPGIFRFSYQHVIHMYSLMLTDRTRSDYTPIIIAVIIIYVVPFIAMSCLTIATACYLRRHVKKGPQLKLGANLKEEIKVFATMGSMQVGFTITLIPVVVVMAMSFSGAFTPFTVAIPYIICFYLSMANSLVNVLVYSVADPKFRVAAKNLLACGKCTGHEQKGNVDNSSSGSKTDRSDLTSQEPFSITKSGQQGETVLSEGSAS